MQFWQFSSDYICNYIAVAVYANCTSPRLTAGLQLQSDTDLGLATQWDRSRARLTWSDQTNKLNLGLVNELNTFGLIGRVFSLINNSNNMFNNEKCPFN